MTHGVGRRGDLHRLAAHLNASRTAWVGPDDGPGGLRAPRSYQAGQPQDLAAAHLEADLAQQILGGQALDLQAHRGASVVGLGPGVGLQAASDHLLDDLSNADLIGRRGRDPPTVAQDGDRVRHPLDLVHAVGDVDDGRVRADEVRHHPEQGLGLALGQRGGGLVHDEDPSVKGERLGDLHHLLGGDRQVPHTVTGP